MKVHTNHKAMTQNGTDLNICNDVDNLKITNAENFEIENSIERFQPFALLSIPNQISGKLTECNNVQFGTRIVTSNFNATDQNNDFSNDANYVEDKTFSDSSDGFNTVEHSYCQIGCEKFDKLLTVLIFFVSLISLLLVVSILKPLENSTVKPDLTTDMITTEYITKVTDPSSAEDLSVTTRETTEKDIPWLISYKEWSGVEQPKSCYKNLPQTDTIKFWYDTAPCNTFKTCKNMLEQEAFIDIVGCHFDDVTFHFAVSEQGLVFECRSTNCEIPPEYKKCNESVLFIKLYIGYTKIFQNEEQCKSSSDFIKQVEGLKNLIDYNRHKGVLLEKPLSIYIVNRYCGREFYQELNKTFDVTDLYDPTVIMCPNTNTCIED